MAAADKPIRRAMLSRYSHVRIEAKPRALDKIAARQNAADEKRKAEAERLQHAALISQSEALQPRVSGWKRLDTPKEARCEARCGDLKDNFPADERCWVRLGDTVGITVTDAAFKSDDELVMWIDGRPMPGVKACIGTVVGET